MDSIEQRKRIDDPAMMRVGDGMPGDISTGGYNERTRFANFTFLKDGSRKQAIMQEVKREDVPVDDDDGASLFILAAIL